MKLRETYTCPLEIVHDMIKGKWKTIIIYLKSRQNTPTSVVDEQVGMNAAIFLFILVFFLFFTNLSLNFSRVRGIMMSTKGGFPT